MSEILLPSPTVWPFVLAFGVALTFGGLATDAWISALGLVLVACGAVGWFRDVLPEEARDRVRVVSVSVSGGVSRPREVVRVAVPALTRAALPREIYPVSAGLRGGLAGGAAMAIVAVAYGLMSGRGVWYPINLLAAGFLPAFTTAFSANLAAFHLPALALATAIHLIASLLVGLLYSAMLPMLPRRPILVGGVVAPLFWSGLVHGILGIVNPVMNQRIDWSWFVVSQIGFGIAAGAVVARLERVPTAQPLPLIVRAGIETPGLIHERERR
jgi:hypothetical protein